MERFAAFFKKGKKIEVSICKKLDEDQYQEICVKTGCPHKGIHLASGDCHLICPGLLKRKKKCMKLYLDIEKVKEIFGVTDDEIEYGVARREFKLPEPFWWIK